LFEALYRRCQLGQGRRGCTCHSILCGEHLLHHRLWRRDDFNRHGWQSGLCGPELLRGDKRGTTGSQE
jgi:hypothetical protein